MSSKKLNIFAQVRDLPRIPALGFCATMLERQVPNFALFCSVVDVEGSEQMQKALDQLWLAFESLTQRKKVTTKFDLLRDKVEQISPDASEFDNFGVYPAIDCAMAMVAALNLVSGQDDSGAVMVSKLSQGSVESLILATEGDLDNADIKQHPLMQREIDFQIALLERLQSDSKQTLTSKALKELAALDGATNIGIALDD